MKKENMGLGLFLKEVEKRIAGLSKEEIKTTSAQTFFDSIKARYKGAL